MRRGKKKAPADLPEVQVRVGKNVIALYAPRELPVLRRTYEVRTNGKLTAVGSREFLNIFVRGRVRKWLGV